MKGVRTPPPRRHRRARVFPAAPRRRSATYRGTAAEPRAARPARRSEEHTSELQSQSNLVCRLLLEKKKKTLVSFKQMVEHSAAHARFLELSGSCIVLV